MKRNLLLIFFFVLVQGIPAQTIQLRYDLPSAAQNSTISVLHKDAKRGLYLGTDRGLFTFNGRDWEHYPLPDSLRNQTITALAIYKSFIVLGLENGKILSFNGVQFSPFYSRVLPISKEIRKIIPSKNEEILIASYGDGLFVLHPDSTYQQFNVNYGLPSNDIYDVISYSHNTIGLATDRGLVSLDMQTNPSVEFPQSLMMLLETHPQRNEVFWGADYDGHIYRFTSGISDTLHTVSSPVVDLQSNSQGKLYIITKDAIWERHKRKTSSFVQLNTDPLDEWQLAEMDAENQLWLINTKNQLVVIPTYLKKYVPESPPIQAISTIDSFVFLGTENGVFQYQTQLDSINKHILSGVNVLDLEWVPARRELWCASFGQGIYIYNVDTRNIDRISTFDGLINDNILNLRKHQDWILAPTFGGLSIIDIASHTIIEGQYDTIPQSQYIYDAVIDDDHRLWLGKDRRGLIRVQQSGKIDSFLSHSTVYQILIDSSGIYCATPDSGIQYLQLPSLEAQSIIGDQNCLAINRDSFGHFYFFSSQGVFIHDPKRQYTNPFYPQYMGKAEYLYSHAHTLDMKNEMWWALGSNLYHYEPQEQLPFQVDLKILSVLLGELQFTRPFKNIVSPYSKNSFRIQYKGHWINDPKNISYRYRIKGYDRDWQYTQDENAIYPNLPPGSYTFIIEADLNTDFSQAQTKKIQFTIVPALWQRPWFQFAMTLLLGVIVWSITRYIIRRNRRMEELKAARIQSELETIKSQINPHFLFNNFNTLINIVEEEPQKAVNYIEQLSDFYRDMLQFRKNDLISIEEELQIVNRYFFLLKHRFEQGLRYQVEGKIESNKQIIPFSIQLLVENAVKHNKVTQRSPLTISIVVEDEYVIVKNNLQLLNIKPPSTSFGLESLNKQYLNACGKELEISKSESWFQVKIPIIKRKKV